MFEDWHDYFFMLGSSAAALIGLMFVVVTLTAGRGRREVEGGKRLYSSPVVWHLGVVVVISGATIAPSLTHHWFGVGGAGLAFLGMGLCVRNAIGINRARLSGSDSNFDTWWYGVIPAVIYAALAVAAAGVFAQQRWGASAVGAGLMALLLISIHAEWDLVTYLAPLAAQDKKDDKA